MYSIQQIFLIIFFSNFKTYLSDFCDPSTHSIHTYNINRNIYIDIENNNLINYDLALKVFKRYKMSDVFTGDKFQSVVSAFNLNYGDCSGSESDCKMQLKARNYVMAIGYLKQSPQDLSYVSYYLYPNASMGPITNASLLMWGWHYSGTSGGNSLVEPNRKVDYSSMVFVKEKSQFLISTHYKDSKLVSETRKRDIDMSGKITNTTTVNRNLYKGMFAIDERVFAINNEGVVLEAKWDISGNVLFNTFSNNEKEFFNCFGNSTVITGNPREDSSTHGSITDMSKVIPNSEIPDETSDEYETEPEESFVSKDPVQDSTIGVIIIVIFVIVLLLIIVTAIVFFLINSRKKSSNPSSSIGNTTNVSDFSVRTIHSTTGQEITSNVPKSSQT